MILTCPACGTQYVVKDGAIPEGGRKVRCASCRHSWHQDAPPLDLDTPVEGASGSEGEEYAPMVDVPAPVPVPPADEAEDYPVPDSVPVEPAGFDITDSPAEDVTADGPSAEPHRESPYEEAVPVAGGEIAELQQPAEAPVDDDFSPFAARETGGRKRRSPLIIILLLILVVAAIAALFWFLAPAEWKARIGITEASQTPLQLMLTHRDRQALASGNELLAVSGRVINPTSKSQAVPPIQAELRSKTGAVVYRWTIAPPTATLAPGASARFNSAEVNVPAGGEELTVSLGAPGA